MKILVNIAHPNIEGSRVNATWLRALERENHFSINELYKEYPNEKIDVEREQELCAAHDRIVFQFPFYWYSSPPLMKKWQDEVLTYGWAYGAGGNKLHGKELILAVSTGSEAGKYQAGGGNHFAMSELLKPFLATSNLIGTVYKPAFIYHGALGATNEEIEASARAYIEYIQQA